MKKIDPDKLGEQLSAYLDDELNEAERSAVETLLRQDREARTELEKLRQTASLIGGLPRHAAPARLAAEVMARIERRQLLGEEQATPAATTRSPGGFRTLLLTAAMIAIALTVGFWGLSHSGRGARDVALVDAGQRSRQPLDAAFEAAAGEPSANTAMNAPASVAGGRREAATGVAPATVAHDDIREVFGRSAALDADVVPAPQPVLGGTAEAFQPAEVPALLSEADSAAAAMSPAGERFDGEKMTAPLSTEAKTTYHEPTQAGRQRRRGRRAGRRETSAPAGILFTLEVACTGSVDFDRCKQVLTRFLPPRERSANAVQNIFSDARKRGSESISVNQDAVAERRRTQESTPHPSSPSGAAGSAVRIEELLVQVPRSQLPALLALLETGSPQAQEVTLSVGQLVTARGWPQSRQLVAMVSSSKTRDPASSSPHQGPVTALNRLQKSTPDPFVPLDRMLKSAGIPLRDADNTDDTLITVRVRLTAPAPPPPGEPGRLAPR